MDSAYEVAEKLDEHLRSLGFATTIDVHPAYHDGAIIGATGGGLVLSITVNSTP